MRSALVPIKQADDTLKTRQYGLFSYFKHSITHTASEPPKSSMQSLEPAARGFCSFENYRVRILFFLKRLNIDPL